MKDADGIAVVLEAMRASAARKDLDIAIDQLEAAAMRQDRDEADRRRAEAHDKLDALLDMKWSIHTGIIARSGG